MENKEYLAQVIKELSKPLPFKWKLQSYNKDKTKALCVAYIDARVVTQKLNEVCVYGWHREHFSIGTDTYCRLGLVMPDNTIQWRSDVGESENATERAKTSSSDSYKRAATCYELGLFLYDMDIVSLPVAKDGNYFNIVKPDGSKVWDLTKYINEEYNKKTAPTPVVKVTPEPVKDKAKEGAKVGKGLAETKPAGAIQPNTNFDKKDDSLEDVEARKKAQDLFAQLDQALVLKNLIAVQKLKYTKVADFVEKESLETVRRIYGELTAK